MFENYITFPCKFNIWLRHYGNILQEYLEETGLEKLYPRAAAYATRPTGLSIAAKTTSMDGMVFIINRAYL